MIFLFFASSLSIFKLDQTGAFPDECQSFYAPNKNGKSKIFNLKKGQILCLNSSYLLGSDSDFHTHVAIQKFEATSQKWKFEIKPKIKNAIAILGSYSQDDNDFLDPVAKVTCDDSCVIQLLEIDPSYSTTTSENVNGVTNTKRINYRTYINTHSSGSIKSEVIFSKKIDGDQRTFEEHTFDNIYFAFPGPRELEFTTDYNLKFYYSGSSEWKNISEGSIENPKTAYINLAIKENYSLPSSETYYTNLSYKFKWTSKEKIITDFEEPIESFFPLFKGFLPSIPGTFDGDIDNDADDDYYYQSSLSNIPGWLIAVIVVFAVIVLTIIIIGTIKEGPGFILICLFAICTG